MRSEPTDDDDDRFGPAPDPDDRLWRHPSELAAATRAPGPPFAARHPVVVSLAAALMGAAVTTTLWFSLGAGDPKTVRVREQVTMAPVIAVAPTLVSDRDWAAAVAERAGDSVVAIELRSAAETRLATAITFTDDGHALVPAHLVAANPDIVVLRDGERVPATIVGRDDSADVAVLKFAGTRVKTAVIAHDAVPAVGARVVVARALPRRTPGTADTSVLSIDNQVAGRLVFRIGSAIDDASDGAAVIDERGAVVGIATTGGGTRDGYAIPAAYARAAAWELIETKKSDRPWLGADLVAASGGRGVEVKGVTRGSPAAESGLVAGDVITAIDGREVTSVTALATILKERGVGATLAVSYQRDGEADRCSVTVTPAP